MVVAALFVAAESNAQACPMEIRGGWEGVLAAKSLLEVTLSISANEDGEFSARLGSAFGEEEVLVRQEDDNLLLQSKKSPLSFDGRISEDAKRIDGFVTQNANLYRVTLVAGDAEKTWSLTWSPLPVASDSVKLDVYFGDDDDGGTAGYFFFRDPRLPGLYGYGMRCDNRNVHVGEKNLGLSFDGAFDAEFSELRMLVSGLGGKTEIIFRPMSAERQGTSGGGSELPPRDEGAERFSNTAPLAIDDGWDTQKPSKAHADVDRLRAMTDAVTQGEYPLTHSILVARSGELIVEEYFYGYDRETLHDMRSASKSISSTLVGLAVDREMIESADSKMLSFFPEYHSYKYFVPAKADISIRNLMTMSSGLDANDSNWSSVASEGRYQSQEEQPDWIKLALDAPMINEPGTHVIYGSANPMILGGVLDNVVGERVEWFAEKSLFQPLGIDRYRIFMDPTGVLYMGGGMHLRPRDMLKIGQMYLDGGRWKGNQILSESWVTDSFAKYGRLEPIERNGNQYGYLWWHDTYEVGDTSVDSIEARGNGGQYIFVVPELDMVAVITSGNYRGGLEMTRQPQRIFVEYVLPALMH
jgi:CubicO group peptidase (beta-lactamase class C family)